jgi:uncharacterized DUF497 family protein
MAAVYITMDLDEILAGLTGFEWDEGNLTKNWEKHQVSALECEQVFFNRPLIALPDERHSNSEPRFYALGQTDSGRRLFIVFTARSDSIRVISARDMSRKERKIYEGS